MKILIVDDELLARERLQSLLAELDQDHSVSEAENGVVALSMIQETKPDILLLDIRMPGMDGLELAQHLLKTDASPSIIFTTAYQDYALDAFDAQAIDYLMKPIRKERLEQALGRAQKLNLTQVNELKEQENTEHQRSHLSATVQGNLELVPIEDVHYLKADHKYVTAVWPEGELLLDDSLKSLEQEYANKFMRIHRNTLVSLTHIQGLEKDDDGHPCIKLTNIETRLPVSRRHAGNVRKIIKSYKVYSCSAISLAAANNASLAITP